MQVEYKTNRSIKVKSADLCRIGRALMLTVGQTQHIVTLSQTQWELLADAASTAALHLNNGLYGDVEAKKVGQR